MRSRERQRRPRRQAPPVCPRRRTLRRRDRQAGRDPAPSPGRWRRSGEREKLARSTPLRNERERERHALGGCPAGELRGDASAAHVLRQLTPNPSLPPRWRWRRRRRSRDAALRRTRSPRRPRRRGMLMLRIRKASSLTPGRGGEPEVQAAQVAEFGARRPRCRAPPAPPQRACWGRLRASPRFNPDPFLRRRRSRRRCCRPPRCRRRRRPPPRSRLGERPPGPSPGRRRAGVRGGGHLADRRLDAVARAPARSRLAGRSSRSPPLSPLPPRSAPLPKTPHGEPRRRDTRRVVGGDPIAPNAARLIATPGRRDGTSPLPASPDDGEGDRDVADEKRNARAHGRRRRGRRAPRSRTRRRSDFEFS